MALQSVYQAPEGEISGETKLAQSLLSRIRLTMDTTALGANFRRYGPSFSIYDYDAFIALAKRFYKEAKAGGCEYSVVDMPGNRIAIDFRGDTRGIYTRKGKPLAFFRPDYVQSGFKSKQEEIQAFLSGHGMFFELR